MYTFGVTGILACWEADTGKNVWTVDTKKEFSPPALRFGVSCSPLIEGDNVIVGPFSSVRSLADGAMVKVEQAPRAPATAAK